VSFRTIMAAKPGRPGVFGPVDGGYCLEEGLSPGDAHDLHQLAVGERAACLRCIDELLPQRLQAGPGIVAAAQCLISLAARQKSLISPSMRSDNSSLIALSWFGVFLVAPGSGQSSPFPSAPMGHLSRQPKVTTLDAPATIWLVTILGVRSMNSIPSSPSSQRTQGLTAAAGLTPALSACHPVGALELNISSDMTLLKVFSTQTNRMVPVRQRQATWI